MNEALREIAIEVNGRAQRLRVAAGETLLDALRERLALRGAKAGCEAGGCGACTVLVDGLPRLACLTLAVRCDGARVLTVEGLAAGAELHPLQEAAIELGAVQCGYCTPGWLLAAKALLDEIPVPSPEDVREALSGNICRCTGYQKIEEAVLAAARRLAERPVREG